MADYVIPPAENGAFFVATNVIITANQSRGMFTINTHGCNVRIDVATLFSAVVPIKRAAAFTMIAFNLL